MKLLSVVVPSAVAGLAAVLLCGPAVSQVAPATSIPSVTVDVPKQAAKPYRHHESVGPATARTAAVAAPKANDFIPLGAEMKMSAQAAAIQGKFIQLEKSASSCNGGCETSLPKGNAPWVGCSLDGHESVKVDAHCTDTLTYTSYDDCHDTKRFLGWDRNKVFWHCTSLLAGGKFKVAEIKRLKN
ncbi:hypothetical protein ACQR1I_26730 [Bradyrhizobium sp. HKCCYLS2038]|uniref:hypothetical protein n=1 Tax=unclassified Bradyrhizobium TaxID=2631580 RepID=UPI003EBAED59